MRMKEIILLHIGLYRDYFRFGPKPRQRSSGAGNADTLPLLGRFLSNYKFGAYVRIMRDLLEEDEATQAMQYLCRARSILHETLKIVDMVVFYKLRQARTLDATRKFLDAATK
jgi:hypothetical protein